MNLNKIDPRLLEFESSAPKSLDPESSNIEKLGQFATGLGVKAATAPFKLVEGVDKLLGAIGGPTKYSNPSGETKYPSEQIESMIPEKYTKPENIVSEILQSTVGNWPLLFLNGPITAAKVGADIFGSAGMHLAEKAGLGTLGQIGASILGSKGFSSAINKGNIGKLGLFKSGLYDKEKAIGANIRVKTGDLKKEINKLYKQTEKKLVSDVGFTQSAKSNILSNLDQIKLRLKPSTTTASKLFEINKDLNAIWSPKKSIPKGIYDHTKKLVNSTLDGIYNKHEDYGKAAKGANELHMIENWQSGLGRWVSRMNESGQLNKIATGLGSTALGYLLHGSSGAATGALLGAGAYGAAKGIQGFDKSAKAVKFINSLSQSKEGQKLMWDIIADSAKGLESDLTKSMVKFNKKAEEFDKTSEDIQKIDPNQLEFA